ncbi:MutH/Sau3AI family endonuclease [Crocinitomicaceae bacterium]|nr:MutH/Sau3AI family endonuclease [Crocinitomicaceae bacterium]
MVNRVKALKFHTNHELVKYYNSHKGLSLSEIYKNIQQNFGIQITTNKGVVGQVLEALVGNVPNSNPNADIENLGVELKVLPLRKVSNRLQPKERSKIKSLNYNTIVNDQWMNSSVRKKMSTILFLMYEQPIGLSFKDWTEDGFVFKGCLLYELKNRQEEIVEEDWVNIQSKVINDDAHNISEGDSLILGACTSGTGKDQVYGKNGFKAKQRSYALKHSYLKQFYFESNGIKYASLKRSKKVDTKSYLLREFNAKLKGKTLDQLASEYNVAFSSNAKSSFSLLINRILKVKDKIRIKEIELLDMNIKTVPVNSEMKPWESMSFPKFSLIEILDERWDNTLEDENDNQAALHSFINRPFLFIPVIKNKIKTKGGLKFEHWTNWRVGKTVYWRPGSTQLNDIKKEWLYAQNIIKQGVEVKMVSHGKTKRQENNLLKAKNTKFIHIRPHARDAKDFDIPFKNQTGIEICWQSFWLNASFIHKILLTEFS